MRLLPVPRARAAAPAGPAGTVRLDRDSSALAGRVRRGDIAVMDHLDLDGGTAARMVAVGVAAVVNAAPSSSGRHPTRGAETLLAAGVPLLDGVGPGIFGALREGQQAVLDLDAGAGTGAVLRTDRGGAASEVARGTVQTAVTVAASAEAARSGLLERLEGLVGDAVETLWRDPELMLDGPPAGLRWAAPVRGRAVLVVPPGPGAAEQLHLLGRWLRRTHPVVVAVDGGARTAAAAGLSVDLLALSGDGRGADSAGANSTDAADSAGANSADAADAGGAGLDDASVRAAGAVLALGPGAAARAEAAGASWEEVDVALPAVPGVLAVLAAAAPDLLVQATQAPELRDLLDLDRIDGAAALLARLRLGGLLLDATAVAALDGRRPVGAGRSRRRRRQAAREARRRRRAPGGRGTVFLLVAGLVCAAAVVAVSDPGRALLHRLGVTLL